MRRRTFIAALGGAAAWPSCRARSNLIACAGVGYAELLRRKGTKSLIFFL